LTLSLKKKRLYSSFHLLEICKVVFKGEFALVSQVLYGNASDGKSNSKGVGW